MSQRPLKVAWISYFPIEWLPELPTELRNLPRQHPASWQRVLLDELRGRPDLKLHVFAVRKQFERDCRFEWEGVQFDCIKVPGGLRTLSLFWLETYRLRRRLRVVQPDLVHAWGTERGAALVAARLGFPRLVTMQGLLQWYSEHVDLGRFQNLEARLEQASLRRSSVVTVESNFGVNWLHQHHPHLEVLQAEHAPNWLFHQVQRHPEIRPRRFLFIGAVSRIKGTDLLLQGLDRLMGELDFQLTIVGSPARGFLDGLRSSISNSLWERVQFRQHLTPAEVAEELSRTTMVLFPTRVDNSPNSVKEAVVAGVPVVASGIGGILDYVVPNRNGLHFPPGDLQGFVHAVRTAAAHPLFGRGAVESDTLEQMRRYLSPRTMSERFRAAYQRALEPAPALRRR